MRKFREFLTSYVLLGGLLLVLLSLPVSITNSWREIAVGKVAPIWEPLLRVKAFSRYLLFSLKEDNVVVNLQKAELSVSQLQVENFQLKNDLEHLKDQLARENSIGNYLEYFKKIFDKEKYEKIANNHTDQLKKLLQISVEAINASVIYRDPGSWSTTLWINKGWSDNQKSLVKNSPVIIGFQVVGVVDYVGKWCSRVKLITDSSLTPSVRVSRGVYEDILFQDHLNLLSKDLIKKENSLNVLSHPSEFLKSIEEFSKKSSSSNSFLSLSKGVLRGSREPHLRGGSHILRGEGFNYDFSDEEGEARDLRTGQLDYADPSTSVSLIEEGDILVTTGMDGVFPPGLMVAKVSKKQGLKEGAFSYEIEALPLISNFNDIDQVFIIPPLTKMELEGFK
jgi:rod shape-determining protein MreC